MTSVSSSTSPSVAPVVDALRADESRSSTAFGYRKPSGEYRVVDFLADGFGFNRKNSPVQYSTFVGNIPQTPSLSPLPPSTTTTVRATSAAPTTTTASPTTISGDYDDDVEEVNPVRANEPSLSSMRILTKGSPAQQARAMFQEHISNEEDEDSNEREVEVLSQRNIKKASKDKRKPNAVKGGPKETSREKLEQQRLRDNIKETMKETTTRSPQARVFMSSGPPSTNKKEAVFVKPQSKSGSSGRLVEGNIRYDKPFSTTTIPTTTSQTTITNTTAAKIPSTTTTTVTPTAASELHRNRDSESNSIFDKISIHQLISEAMPTLQMSVVPVYFMNRATKQVIAVPYLVMKSISKMPLIPNGMMFDGMSPVSRLSHFQNQRLSQSRLIPPLTKGGFNLLTLRPNLVEDPPQSVEESDDLPSEVAKKIQQEKNEENSELESEDDVSDPRSDLAGSASVNKWFTIHPPTKSKRSI